jgi:magnesium-transporting ATPase (P-type)
MEVNEMDELNVTDTEMKTDERHLYVTVFGVLNCVFGVIGIVSAIMAISIWLGYDSVKQHTPNSLLERMAAERVAVNISYIIYLAISVYLLILGCGLLKMKTWARKGSIICAWMFIIWCLATPLTYLAIMAGTKTPMNELLTLITRYMNGLQTGLVYPILLIIFMKTRELREAFQGLESPPY